jgi:hypothetical protein
MKKYNLDTICEIGVRDGQNFRQMIKHNPKVAVAVDCWIDDGVLSRNDILCTQETLDKQYEAFKNEFGVKPFVKIHRAYSFDVAKEYPDEYFDLIYIDADHTYEGVKKDLNDWYPKLKHCGIFCGHDYARKVHDTAKGKLTFGVVEAVNEFVKLNNIKTFFRSSLSVWGIIKL